MANTSVIPAELDDDDIFSAESYRLRVPQLDGYKAETITLRFVGVVNLDRTSEQDLEFIDALRLGQPVRLIVNGTTAGKGFSHKPKSNGEATVGYYAALRVEEVEIGEAA